jgi:hypothetical protein
MSGWKSAVSFYPKRTGNPGRDRHARTVQFACLVLASAVCTLGILNVVSADRGEASLLIFAVVALMGAMAMNRAGRWEWATRIACCDRRIGRPLTSLTGRQDSRHSQLLL